MIKENKSIANSLSKIGSQAILTLLISVLCSLDISAQTRAMDSGFRAERTCIYNARPQGVQIEVQSGRRYVSQSDTIGTPETVVSATEVEPRYYSDSRGNLNVVAVDTNITDGGAKAVYLGYQTKSPGGGKAIDGGFARDSQGAIIAKKIVYLIRKPNLAGAWKGWFYSKANVDVAGVCGSYNHANQAVIALNQNRPPNVPVVPSIGHSIDTYLNTGPPTGGSNSTIVSVDDFDVDEWNSGFTVGNFSDLMTGLTTREWGGYFRSVDPDFGSTQEQIETAINAHDWATLRQIANQLSNKGLGDYVGAVIRARDNGFEYRRLPLLPPEPLTEITVSEGNLVLPNGWLNENYPRPNPNEHAPNRGSGNNRTPLVFPSYLFDPPKSQAWYYGNKAGGQFGNVRYWGHLPLPTFCNPKSKDYVPAAFLNAEVLEELRLDWRYLSDKNYKTLKEKYGYDFFNQYWDNFIATCPLSSAAKSTDNPTDYCFQQAMRYNENLKRKPIYPPNIKNIKDVTATSKTGSKSVKKKKPGLFGALGRLKPRGVPTKSSIKTEAYYQDLIDNRLTTRNPKFSVKACKPKLPMKNELLKKP